MCIRRLFVGMVPAAKRIQILQAFRTKQAEREVAGNKTDLLGAKHPTNTNPTWEITSDISYVESKQPFTPGTNIKESV